MITLSRPYLRATAVSIYFSFTLLLLSPVLAPYVKSLGFNNFQLGALSAIFSIVTIFSAPLMGSLSDTVGRRKVILAGILLQIISIIIYFYSSNWIHIAFSKILDALAFSTVTLISIAAIQDHLKKSARGKYTGISFTLQNIGDLIAPIIGGIIADLIFVRAPFVISIILLSILFFYMFLSYKEKRISLPQKRDKFVQSFKWFLSEKKLFGLAIIGITIHFASPAIGTFLSVFAFERLSLNYTHIGYILFAAGLAHLSQFYFGKLSDRIGREKMLAIGLAVDGIGTVAIGFAQNFETLFIIMLLRGFGGAATNIGSWALLSDIGEKAKKEGEAIGTYISFSKISQFASFFISGYIADAFGFSVLFALAGVVTIIGALIGYRLINK